MPISNKRFTEIRFMISDMIQRRAWEELYENCGTNDIELAKSVANIFSMFDPSRVWQFIDYVLRLPADVRRERRDSTLTVSLAMGRISQDAPERALKALKTLLSDDHMLRAPVEASLSNLWVFDRKATEKGILDSWIESGHENDDLQEIGVRSCDYIYSQDPKHVEPFLVRVLSLGDPKYRPAQNAAKELVMKYDFGKKLLRRQATCNKDSTSISAKLEEPRRKKNKHKSHKKKNKKRRKKSKKWKKHKKNKKRKR